MNIDKRSSLQEWKKKCENFWIQEGRFKYMHGRQNDDVSGDYIFESKNVHNSWMVNNGWNLRYCEYLVALGTKDSYDVTQFGNNIERSYEILQGGDTMVDIKFSWFIVTQSRNIEYSVQALRSADCFGCVSIRDKQYCILNKQYGKEEYEELLPKIKQHMNDMPYVDAKGRVYKYGEFFPTELSPFEYNETTAQEYFPLSKEESLQQNFGWKDEQSSEHTITMSAGTIPESINEVNDSILQQVLECRETKKPFRIVATELQFYQQTGLPLPDLHPDVRHKNRMERRNQPKYYKRTTEDGKDVLTAYAPDRPERILSEEGYQNEVL